MTTANDKIQGSCYIFLYAVVTAASSVLIHDIEKSLNPFYSVFYAFLFSTIFYVLIALPYFKSNVSKIKANLITVVAVNVTTLFTWLFTFLALQKLDAYLASALILGSIPICTTIVLAGKFHRQKTLRRHMLSSFVILGLLILLIYEDLLAKTNSTSLMLSVLMAFIAGGAISINNLVAKKLSSAGVHASLLMATRFILLIIVSFGCLRYQRLSIALTWDNSYWLLVTACFSVALPLYLLQKGIERVSPMQVSYLLPFVPMLAYILGVLTHHFDFYWHDFIFIALLAVSMCVVSVFEAKH